MGLSELARGVVAGGLVALLGGCSNGSAPAATVTPTPSASPTETQLQRQTRLDFEAAEKSYRTFRAEYNRVLAAGGAKQPTKVMTETAGGPYLAEFTKIIQAYDKGNYTQNGGETIVYARRGGYSHDALVLNTCEDGRKNATYDSKGKLFGRGEIRTAHILVRKMDGRWKLWTVDGEKVKSCS